MSEKKEISSGAEKAEKLALANKSSQKSKSATGTKKGSKVTKDTGSQGVKQASTSKPKASTASKVQPSVSTKKESKNSQVIKDRKLEHAKIKAEKSKAWQAKRLESKQKRAERIAVLKEHRAERKEKRRERIEELRSKNKALKIQKSKEERKAIIAERVAKREALAADRRARREHQLKLRAEKRAERNDKRHAPGFGGWLAAVISLGVTTLALGTVLTYGLINMNGLQADLATAQTESLYELNSLVDNLDTNLSKARVANSDGDRAKIFTDIAIESEMAEMLLERVPCECNTVEQLTAFLNKMSDSAQEMLFTVVNGGELTTAQLKSIDYMYETNLSVKRALNEMTAQLTQKDIVKALKGKKSDLLSGFGDIQNNVISEPSGIQDGPFAESVKVKDAKFLKGLNEISAKDAEEICKQVFADHKVSDTHCTGEAKSKGLDVFNVAVKTKSGDLLAQITKKGGKVVMFDSFKDCQDKNFSVERCIDIAEEFLGKLGYENVKAVWTSENGTTCNLNFTPVLDGAILYPDIIKVKVCEERGLVTGLEAISYVENHTERKLATPTLNRAEAQSKVNGNVEIGGARLCVILVKGEETLCYEFVGECAGREYYSYIDARTGEEVQILTVIGTAQGRAIM